MDLAWLAGFMEGESSFSTGHARKNRISLRISTKSTDEDVLRRAHAVTGYGTVNGPYVPGENNHGKKPYWCWSVHKEHEAAGLMMTLYPLLGQRRQARIAELLNAWLQKPLSPQKRPLCGKGVHPKGGTGRCMECKREYDRTYSKTHSEDLAEYRRKYQRRLRAQRRAA